MDQPLQVGRAGQAKQPQVSEQPRSGAWGGRYVVDGEQVLHAELAGRGQQLLLVAAPRLPLAHDRAEVGQRLGQRLPLRHLIVARAGLLRNRNTKTLKPREAHVERVYAPYQQAQQQGRSSTSASLFSMRTQMALQTLTFSRVIFAILSRAIC